MDRTTLEHVLGRAAGVSGKDGRFEVADDFRVSFYLGRVGHATTVNKIKAVELDERVVILTRREEGQVFTDYDTVYAVGSEPTEEAKGRRAGFA